MILDLDQRIKFKFAFVKEGKKYEIEKELTFEHVDLIGDKAEKIANISLNANARNKNMNYIEEMEKQNRVIARKIDRDFYDEIKDVLSEKELKRVVNGLVTAVEQAVTEHESEIESSKK